MRLEAISFFVLALLLSALLIRWLWNRLTPDFPRLPRLSYGKSLAIVVLWGSLFLVVLTMIAATRETMTPGVWAKQGLLYHIPTAATTPPTDAGVVRLLLFGWFSFLHRNLPGVAVNVVGVATGVVVFALTLGVVHWLGWSWRRGGVRTPWRFRWSLTVVLAVMVLFAAGFSMIGLARHVGWLFSTTAPTFAAPPSV